MSAPSSRKILGIALPLILASFGYSLVSAADTLFLGRTGDIIDLAAIGLMSPFYLFVTLLGFSFSRGGQILIARRLGEKSYPKVRSVAQNMFYCLLAFAVLFYIGLKFNGRAVLAMFVDSDELLEVCFQYLYYRIDGILFSFAGIALIAFYTGISRTKIVLAATVVLASVNIALNYLLIFGNWGFPEMGIAGAGLASSLAEVAAFIVLALFFVLDEKITYLRIFRFGEFNSTSIRTQLSLSTPIALQSLLGLGSWIAFFGLIENYGEEALAVSSVVRALYLFLGVPAWGLASATNTIVSSLIGENKGKYVFPTLKKLTTISLVITSVGGLSILLYPEMVISLVTNDYEVIQATAPLMQLLFVILIGMAIHNVYFNGIVGTGAIKTSLSFQTIAVVCYLGYIYFVIVKLSGSLMLAWSAELIHAAIIFLLSVIYLKSNRWYKFRTD